MTPLAVEATVLCGTIATPAALVHVAALPLNVTTSLFTAPVDVPVNPSPAMLIMESALPAVADSVIFGVMVNVVVAVLRPSLTVMV